MKDEDFNYYFFGLPFLGGFLAYIICYIAGNRESAAISIILGVATGYMALICIMMYKKFFANSDTDKVKEHKE